MIKNYINGQRVESSKTFDTFNPATGEHLASVAQASPEQVAQGYQYRRYISRGNPILVCRPGQVVADHSGSRDFTVPSTIVVRIRRV